MPAASEHLAADGRVRARVSASGAGRANVTTGLPALDHLLTLLAEHGAFDIELEVAPGAPDEEVVEAAQALGAALADSLTAEGRRRHGSAVVPADEALAHVALEASGRPLVVSNVDLTEARIGGLPGDVVARFLNELAEGAGLTLHVRLIEGEDTQHVLDAIFKALGVALAEACRPRVGEER